MTPECKQLVDLVEQLGKRAGELDEPEFASMLYGVCGAMYSGKPGELCRIIAMYARIQSRLQELQKQDENPSNSS